MSTRGPNARGRATVAAIESAALALAHSRVVEQITVAAICERAEVTERVFFNHFPTKEDAFLGLEIPTLDEDWAIEYINDDGHPAPDRRHAARAPPGAQRPRRAGASS